MNHQQTEAAAPVSIYEPLASRIRDILERLTCTQRESCPHTDHPDDTGVALTLALAVGQGHTDEVLNTLAPEDLTLLAADAHRLGVTAWTKAKVARARQNQVR